MAHEAAAVELVQGIREQVFAQGFQAVGFAKATEADGFQRLLEWIESGSHAGMAFMERGALARRHPESILPGVKTVIMAAMPYAGGGSGDVVSVGKVARYARGPDYHGVLWDRLGIVLKWIELQLPGIRGRVVADTAPLLERDFARRAGLGWIGRNTMLINQRLGSFTVLGAILVDVEMPSDPPFEADRCGTCQACVSSCPTGALSGDHGLDAGRCLSYWTIEHRGAGPDWVPEQLEGWLFGCDICQEVCPWNRKPVLSVSTGVGQSDDLAALNPRAILAVDDDSLRRMFRKTAIWRARPEGLRRNALWLLGNHGDIRDLPLVKLHVAHADPGVRAAAEWAIKQLSKCQ